jgi:hypothetical protein
MNPPGSYQLAPNGGSVEVRGLGAAPRAEVSVQLADGDEPYGTLFVVVEHFEVDGVDRVTGGVPMGGFSHGLPVVRSEQSYRIRVRNEGPLTKVVHIFPRAVR